MRSRIITEGKTKKIIRDSVAGHVLIFSKDDITPGNGKQHEVWKGKGAVANQTTCNIFRFLQECGIPTAYIAQKGNNTFLAHACEMIPYKVTARREAHGPYLTRHPEFSRGHYFPKLIVEFCLKTKDKLWEGKQLVCDDPLIEFYDDRIELYDTGQIIHGQKSFLTLNTFPLQRQRKTLEEIEYWTKKVFYILERAWQILGKNLVDIKLEFGFIKTPDGLKLVLSDVIDSDSLRLLEGTSYLDKEPYRKGATEAEVMPNFRKVAYLTSLFSLPKQRIIFWRCSPKDDCQKQADEAYLYYTLDSMTPEKDIQHRLEMLTHNDDCVLDLSAVKSAHKEPIPSIEKVHQLTQEIPDSVLIVYVGMSNGAAPVLSGQVTIPVIAVPANLKEFKDDIWSSLRMPSDIPILVVGDIKNGILNALRILAKNNPHLYAKLRIRQEEKLVNYHVC